MEEDREGIPFEYCTSGTALKGVSLCTLLD